MKETEKRDHREEEAHAFASEVKSLRGGREGGERNEVDIQVIREEG